MSSNKVRTGCELLIENPPEWFRSARLGLLANQASVTSAFESVGNLIMKEGGRLSCLLSPQHGYHSEKQANMIESGDGWDNSFSIPVYSLYGSVREPTPQMLEKFDVLLIDLQDVGTRVYTYSTTMGLCIEAASRSGKKVVILDRPNPINGTEAEGNILKENHRSFVGRYPIPIRHGLTMGELARYIVKTVGIACDLQVIAMEGWKRGCFFPGTGLPWIFPSPNMPSWETALLYPGMVLLEGTNISEGRGTTLPFHLFGSPFIDQQRLGEFLNDCGFEGVVFRPVCFEPVFDKWSGELCYGFQIHLTDPRKVRPYRIALSILQATRRIHPEEFAWLPPPYEYEREKLPIDILIGDGAIREKLESGAGIENLEAEWAGELAAYRDDCDDCLLYGE